MPATNSGSDKSGPKFVTRIDPPHHPVATPTHRIDPIEAELAHAPADPEHESVLAAAGLSADSANDQLRLQASQLTVYLQTRQRDLDRREAILNSQLAQQDNELRVHRLWMSEREVDVNEHELQLRSQIQELEQRIATLSVAEVTLENSQQTLHSQESERELQFNLREERLNERERTMSSGEAAFQAARIAFAEEKHRFAETMRHERQQLAFLTECQWQSHRRLLTSIERHRESLDRKEQSLASAYLASVQWGNEMNPEESNPGERGRNRAAEQQKLALLVKRERQLDQQLAEFERDRRLFEQDRREELVQIERQRSALSEDRNNFKLEIADAQARLAERAQNLDNQRVVVEKLHTECSDRHREALELRLAAEQTWAELCGKASTATITQVTANVRRQLAEEYRDSLRLLSERRQELLTVAHGLEHRRSELLDRHIERQDWLARRQAELEEQARQLHERECQIEEQSRELRARAKEWSDEKRILLRQLRDQKLKTEN